MSNIQQGMNQLLTLTAVAARTSPYFQTKAAIREGRKVAQQNIKSLESADAKLQAYKETVDAMVKGDIHTNEEQYAEFEGRIKELEFGQDLAKKTVIEHARETLSKYGYEEYSKTYGDYLSDKSGDEQVQRLMNSPEYIARQEEYARALEEAYEREQESNIEQDLDKAASAEERIKRNIIAEKRQRDRRNATKQKLINKRNGGI